MATKANPQDQVLPAKDKVVLKSVYTFLDNKQYKKSLKACEQILASYPTNGEALAAKGLCMAYTCPFSDAKAKKDALDLIKRGVIANLKSAEVWNMQGLFYKHEKLYAEAMKSFTQALKLSPDNNNIGRDLAYTQAQTRNWDAYIETRRRFLAGNAAHGRINWPGYAVANLLGGRHDVAVAALDCFDAVLSQARALGNDDSDVYRVEDSELYLFKVKILMEKGDYTAALSTLLDRQSSIVDTVELHTMRADCYSKLGDNANAEVEFRWLLDANPDNHIYHFGLRTALGLAYTPAEAITTADGSSPLGSRYSQLKELYTQLAVQFPKCDAVKRLPLDFLVGEDFRAAVQPYIRTRLSKGVPSLFKDLRDLYTDAAKASTVAAIVETYRRELTANGRFEETEEKDSASPSCLLWALTFLGYHHDYLGDTARALECVDEALAHTPTHMDLYMLKAGIYKHAGDVVTATHWINQARSMDEADRYINNKATRYALQAGDDDSAERMMRLFIKDEDMLGYLYMQQCNWYHTQQGLCYRNRGIPALALKKLLTVEDHFDSYYESLYDYHLYCPRKGTMRAYADMTRYLDSVRKHKFYVRAVTNLVDLYLSLARQQAAEKRVFAARVVKGTGLTPDQYQKGEIPADLKANLDAKVALMEQDKNVVLGNIKSDFAGEYEARPQYEERVKVLEKKKKKGDDVEDRFAFGKHHPDVDFYGWELVTPGTDYTKEAGRYADLLLSGVKDPVLAALFLACDTAAALDKPLLAAQRLSLAVAALNKYKQEIADGKVSATNATRAQVVGLPWFSFEGVNGRFKAVLFPVLMAAQALISKVIVTLAANQHKSSIVAAQAHYDKAVAAAKVDGILSDDVVADIRAYVATNKGSFTEAAVAAIAAIRAFAAAKQAGVTVDLAAEVKALFAFQDLPAPQVVDRAVLRAAIHTIDEITGVTMASQPSLEGVIIAADEVALVKADELAALRESVRVFASTKFPHDTTFMTTDEATQVKKAMKVTVAFKPAKE